MKQLSFLIIIMFSMGTERLNAQFYVDTLAKGPEIDFPVTISFSPDSSRRLMFTEKNNGNVRIIQNDTLLPTPFVTLPVATDGEQGMIGVTFHPQYPDSPYVFIFYTRSSDRANLVVKYTDQNNTGINPQTLMVVTRTTSAVYHNGGNLHFGPDGKLYVTIGDYAVTASAQDTSRANKRGKINRINTDGTIPFDNPIPGNSLYSYGHRNSFDFTFDNLTGKFYATENGLACNDEINLIIPLGNYGWPNDGNCVYSGNPKYVKPLYYWQTSIPAFTGVTIYRDSVIPWLYGKMLVTSYNYGDVYEFTLNATGDSIVAGPTTIFSYGSGLNDIEVGPDGYLYLTNGTYSGNSSLLRLRPPTDAPSPPTLLSPVDDTVNQPLSISFKWQPSPVTNYYHIQVALDSLFTTLVADDSTIIDTAFTLDSLEHYTTYFWRVGAKNSLGIGEYSQTRGFRTVIQPPGIPTLLFPLDNSFIQQLYLTLRWESSPLSETYRVQVSKDSVFGDIIFDNLFVMDTFLTIGPLENTTLYYWRVHASNPGGGSEYSPIWNFFAYDSLTFLYKMNNRWNLLSIPVLTFDLSKDFLFPLATSQAFSYSVSSGYRPQDSLSHGQGFWLRFETSQTMTISGEYLTNDTIALEEGWNLVGSISDTVPTEAIYCLPPEIQLSKFYGFEEAYFVANAIIPGRGYWVKASSAGALVYSSTLHKQSPLNTRRKKQ